MMGGHPWAIVLTHRKGSALVAARPDLFFASDRFGSEQSPSRDSAAAALAPLLTATRLWGFEHPQFAAELTEPSPEALLFAGVAALLGQGAPTAAPSRGPGLAVWVSDSPTAETLRSHFVQVVDAAGTAASALTAIGYAAGPEGSFTGLRLGAAFASGLTLDRPEAKLVPLVTSPLQVSGSMPHPTHLDAAKAFERDEVLAAVARFLWHERGDEALEGVQYRSEPGPVLVLKGQSR